MRQMLAILIAVAVTAAPAPAGETGSRALSGWFNVTTPEGWRGRRYMDGSMVFAEEFDANADGRIDVWRFYRRGILTSEERDTDGDGRVDLVTRYDPATGFVTAVLRDTNRRGVNDIEIERTAARRWVVYQDRNLDGTTDRIVYINAPPDLFERHNIDPASTVDISSAIPREYWHEMWSDDGFSGSITDYFRYNNRGLLAYYGQWNGRRITWNRVPPDFVPRPVTPTLMPQRPLPPEPVLADGMPPPVQPQPVPQIPVERPGTVRDPFDMGAGRADVDPYYGMEGPPATLPQQPVAGPAPAPSADYYAPTPSRVGGGAAWPGENLDYSAARAVPARMRPPGQARTGGR